jgi:cytochrome c551/c552
MQKHSIMKKFLAFGVISSLIFFACNGGGSSSESQSATVGGDTSAATPAAGTTDTANVDKRGIGKFTHVDLGAHLDQAMAQEGENLYLVKCSPCHKLTDEKLVGPGWKGITERQTPEWIMNFVTNTEEMLNKDTKAKELLEICLVRMPNQNLSDKNARELLEFMRKNDGVK